MMCEFFSVCSDGNGKLYYFGSVERKRILKGKSLKKGGTIYETADSHTSIADFYGFKGKDEDKLNKFEWNPLTKELQVDNLGAKDDTEWVRKELSKLKFGLIVPELIIKPIFNPFSIDAPKITQKHIRLLKSWASVRDSVGASVGASVGDSVRASVGASVGDSVWDSVWASVWASVRASVGASVWASVRDSVWASVGSFFRLPRGSWKYTEKIKCKDYPFQPCVDLWMQGLVPAYDGKKWMLFGKKDGKVQKLYEWKPSGRKVTG